MPLASGASDTPTLPSPKSRSGGIFSGAKLGGAKREDRTGGATSPAGRSEMRPMSGKKDSVYSTQVGVDDGTLPPLRNLTPTNSGASVGSSPGGSTAAGDTPMSQASTSSGSSSGSTSGSNTVVLQNSSLSGGGGHNTTGSSSSDCSEKGFVGSTSASGSVDKSGSGVESQSPKVTSSSGKLSLLRKIVSGASSTLSSSSAHNMSSNSLNSMTSDHLTPKKRSFVGIPGPKTGDDEDKGGSRGQGMPTSSGRSSPSAGGVGGSSPKIITRGASGQMLVQDASENYSPTSSSMTGENSPSAVLKKLSQKKFNGGEGLSSSGSGGGAQENSSNARMTRENSSGSSLNMQKSPSTKNPAVPKIRYVKDVSELYSIGHTLMPSTHRGQEVREGARKRDGLPVVVKIRSKFASFKDDMDISTWSANMEQLLHLPDDFSPFIARLLEIVYDKHDYYVIMERVNGVDLFELAHSGGKCFLRLDTTERCALLKRFAREIFSGLAAYAAEDLVHRDLKLENVVLHKDRSSSSSSDKGGPSSSASSAAVGKRGSSSTQSLFSSGLGPDASVLAQKIDSLGICKIVDFDTIEHLSGNRNVDVMGTDQYIAPESYAGLYSPASDVFAAGVMIFKLATGKFPFPDEFFDDEPGQNYVGHPKMREIRHRLRSFRVNYDDHEVFLNHPDLREFMHCCLRFDDRKRITAAEALGSKWLRS